MRYLSVCSGIEAATVAWHPLGWSPVAFAEIEKFPSAVLAHHYPHVPNLGDMTKFGEWPDVRPDVLVGGTPCQSFSVAGLRKGMADPRGNLALTYLAIADRYRPEWLLWENVPGVLSSNGGRDFGAILGGMVELGYGVSYRVLDAQYVRVDGFGRAVPQRRRRVFVVGNSRDWRRAAAVLFERESLSWNSAPSRQAGSRIAAGALGGTSPGGGWRFGPDEAAAHQLVPEISQSLLAKGNDSFDDSLQSYVTSPISHCLNAGGMGRQDYETETVVAVAFDTTQITSKANRSVPQLGDPCHPLAAGAHPPAIAFQGRGSNIEFGKEVAGTISQNVDRASGGAPCIAFDTYNQIVTGDVVQTLCSRGDTPGGSAHLVPAVQQNWAVRRLTPTECERLQGFPDGYTNVPWRGKNGAPDGPRYKALGNSMAANAMRWLGTRIQMTADLTAEVSPHHGGTP